jgi:hypothetical protein
VKKRRVLIVISGCLAAAVIGFLLWPRAREREPEYNGIALSAWLTRCFSSSPTEQAMGADAVRQMGTNVLPTLTRWIQYETPGWRKQLWRLGAKPSFLNRNETMRLLLVGKPANRAILAEGGFAILGPGASNALPDLRRLANNSEAPDTQGRAVRCITHVARFLPPGDFDPF